MASDAPLTDDNAHVAALCSMMELFLQHGLNPTAPRHAGRLHLIPVCIMAHGHLISLCTPWTFVFCFPVQYRA